MYLKKIPGILQRYYPEYLWKKEGNENILYLTFDDGPTPSITPWVLDQLAEYKAKATFFLIGKNVKDHPEILHRILDEGHAVGNHTQHHMNGWKTPLKTYLKDALLAQQTIAEYSGFQTTLFRPPYGKINTSQARRISQSHQIVMMDVISGDFDTQRNGEECCKTVVKNAKPGSIVLLHDSEKAWSRLESCLPHILESFQAKGYRFEALPQQSHSKLVPTRE
ncbi:MAG: polysaccharide deacetylase family protein [Bacteroidota bacterium]